MGFFSNLWSGIKSGVSNLYNRAKDSVSNVWNSIKPHINKIPLVGNMISNTVEHVGKAIDTGARSAGNIAEGKIKDFGKEALRYGANLIGSKIPVIGDTVSRFIQDQVPNLRHGGMVKAHHGHQPHVAHDSHHKVVFQRH
jgi:phage-related protein